MIWGHAEPVACIWPGCTKTTPHTWYCQEHYLAKEAGYALYDVFHNPEFLKQSKKLTLNRLLAYASYRQQAGK